MIQIDVENQLYIMNGNLNDLTDFNDAAQNELRTIHEGIMTHTGEIIFVAELQEKGWEKLEKYCESLAEEMELVSHLPNQPHPIIQNPMAVLRKFIQFFNHITTVSNSTISAQMYSDYFVMVTLKHKQSLYTVKKVCEPQLDSLLYNSEPRQSVCLSVCVPPPFFEQTSSDSTQFEDGREPHFTEPNQQTHPPFRPTVKTWTPGWCRTVPGGSPSVPGWSPSVPRGSPRAGRPSQLLHYREHQQHFGYSTCAEEPI